MSQPESPRKAPYPIDVKAGETYWWCACGRSADQPFCDGSHQGTGIAPVEFTASADEQVWFCGCKHSAAGAQCDGSHKTL